MYRRTWRAGTPAEVYPNPDPIRSQHRRRGAPPTAKAVGGAELELMYIFLGSTMTTNRRARHDLAILVADVLVCILGMTMVGLAY